MEGIPRPLPQTIKSVGLLGSHVFGINPNFLVAVVNLGRELAKRKIRLAYGGGNIGLQGGVASTVYNNNGQVIRFIPTHIAARGAYGRTYGAEHQVPTNYSRLYEMNYVVEASVVLPGGVGTIEGLFTLISWVTEGLIRKPIGLLNAGGYFNNLLKFLDEAVRQNSMAVSQRSLFSSSVLISQLFDKMEFVKAHPGVDYERSVNPEGLDLELHL